MKTTSRAITELENMFEWCREQMKPNIEWYFTADKGLPQVPLINVQSTWRRKMPFAVAFKTWESKTTQAIIAIAGTNQTKPLDEVTFNAQVLGKPLDEILSTVWQATAWYYMKHRSYNKTSNYVTGSELSFLYQAGCTYDSELEVKLGIKDKTKDSLQNYAVLDNKAFDVYQSKKDPLTPKAGSPLKKWGCPQCNRSVRLSRTVQHIKCGDCTGNPDYEYVDKDYLNFYGYTNHNHAAVSSVDASCRKCGKDQYATVHTTSWRTPWL